MSKLATEATGVINTLANGDKKTFIWSLVMMSCICPSTLYYYCIFNKEFMELDFAKVLLVTVSIGISSFLIFIVSSIITYIIATIFVDDRVLKNYDDPYKYLLLFPALLNIIFYASILCYDFKDLNTIDLNTMNLQIIFVIIAAIYLLQIILVILYLKHKEKRIIGTKKIKKVKIMKWIIYRISK